MWRLLSSSRVTSSTCRTASRSESCCTQLQAPDVSFLYLVRQEVHLCDGGILLMQTHELYSRRSVSDLQLRNRTDQKSLSQSFSVDTEKLEK